MGEVGIAVADFSGGGNIESPELIEQRGLPAAGRAEEDDKFARIKIEINARQRAHLSRAFAVMFGEAAHTKDRRRRRRGYMGQRGEGVGQSEEALRAEEK